jgi:signal transduction histidine kinase
MYDITEQKQAEEKIRQMNVELEQRVEERTRELREAQEQLVRQEKLAVLGQLASGVGHELRNPLAIINNAVYYLKLVQPQADQKIKDYHAIIEKETRTAEKIITDLLDFARIKSVDREAVPVSELVERVLNRLPPPPPVTVSLDLPNNLPKLFVDTRQVEQVLGNLVTNACQAMPGGGQLSVIGDQLSVNSEQWVRIAVQDTGVGIPPENMKKLFEPLFTTKLKGIGLGLAVSRKLAEANGGRIEVQSEAGKGSTFTLWLPAHQERES